MGEGEREKRDMGTRERENRRISGEAGFLVGEGTHRWWGADWVKLSGAVGVRPKIVRGSENSIEKIPLG